MNFIFYEDESEFIEIYKKVIMKLMGHNNLNYNIIELNSFKDYKNYELKEIENNKIYVLDIEVPGKSGIELAREIRNRGDWTSQIIIVTNHVEFQNVGYTRKILMLDFISKKNNIEQNLYDAFLTALEINSYKKTFCFQKQGELFQIPYQDILYIEKNINDNSSNIVTKSDIYQVRDTIQNLEKQFSDSKLFFKSHRSYLVNIKNIKHINFDNGEISFSSTRKALLSRANKKKLKDKMFI